MLKPGDTPSTGTPVILIRCGSCRYDPDRTVESAGQLDSLPVDPSHPAAEFGPAFKYNNAHSGLLLSQSETMTNAVQMGCIAPGFDYPAFCTVKAAVSDNRQAGIGGDETARLVQRLVCDIPK